MATEITHTIGTNGGLRDYTSISAWESAQQRNLVTADEIANGECYNDGLMTDRVTFSGWTTDTTRYIKVYTPSGQRHTGVENTGFRMRNNFTGHAFNFLDANVRIEGLEVYTTSASYDNFFINTTQANSWFEICYNLNDDARYNVMVNAAPATCDVKVWNNFIFGCTIGIYVWDTDAPCYLYSNSIANCANYGILVNTTNAVVAKDCACLENGNDFGFKARFGASSDYNASTAASGDTDGAPGANSVHGATGANNFVNATVGSENLHVKDTAANIYNTGTDLSADPDLAFSDDIDGNTRTGTWDIGGDEYQAAVTYTQTFSLDAAIQETFQDTASMDMFLVGRLTESFSLDADILATLETTFDLDANIASVLRFSLDVDILATYNVTYDLDALVGGTPITHTVGTNGALRDYTTLSAWEAAQQRDLVAAGQTARAECYNDGVMEDRLIVNGWTTSAYNYIHVYTPDTQRCYGPNLDGFTLRSNVNTHVISIQVPDVWIEGIKIRHQASTGSYDGVNINASAATGTHFVKVSHCLIENMPRYCIFVQDLTSNINGWYWNNFTSNDGPTFGVGIYVWHSSGEHYLYNNTAYNLNYGFVTLPGTYTPQIWCSNCVALGSGTEDFHFSTFFQSGSNNVSSDATAPGASPVTGAVASDNFRDIVSTFKDLRIKDADADIWHAGADLAEAAFPFEDDAFSESREQGHIWAVGADDWIKLWFNLDTIIWASVTGTFSLDAFLVNRLTTTFGMDADVLGTSEVSFALDANIIAPAESVPPSNLAMRVLLTQ